ncbi:MAG: glycosyltransferase, partial [Elusimicrobia bacterium]|nr:glycosyltransferase [Elusimicrobiota bacterium]
FNPKVNNASNAAPFVKHDLILLSDSDVRVREDFLRRMTAPLGDPGVGLVTAFYRAGPAAGFWSRLESLSVNAQFLPQALVAAAFGMRFAMGAAMLVRREAFERAGGFQGMANHLADDFILGEGVKSAGYRIALADCVVESMPDGGGALECLGHQARWARTIRLCNPEGYLGSMPLHGFSWLTAKLLMIGFDPWSAALALGVLLAKAASGAFIARLCESAPDSALLLPLSEWLSCGAWLFGFRSTKVLWRGQLYEVEPRGRLVPAREPARLAEPIAAP